MKIEDLQKAAGLQSDLERVICEINLLLDSSYVSVNGVPFYVTSEPYEDIQNIRSTALRLLKVRKDRIETEIAAL